MRKNRIFALLLFSLAVIGLLWGVRAQQALRNKAEQQNMGLSLMADSSFLEGKERVLCAENPGVYFEEVLLPYDAGSNTLYVAQNRNEEAWSGMLKSAGEEYVLYAAEDSYWDDKPRAIQENHQFTVWLVGREQYYEMQLIVSGGALISMQTEAIVEPEELVYEEDPDKYVFDNELTHEGSIEVFNPGIGTDEYEIVQAGVSFHVKGATAQNYEKKSYAIELTNKNGSDVNVSLLGMRSDNSWKLNSLFGDKNRVREITASQIWEGFCDAEGYDNTLGPEMEYVELILDNEYCGVYCLVESVNADRLNLKQNEYLYKIVNWDVPTYEDIQESIDAEYKVRYPIRIRYPKVIADYEQAWNPMRDFLRTYYYEGDVSYEEIIGSVDIHNAIDYTLFLMATSACDNTFKNMYCAARYVDGEFVMQRIPWDLDYTFGNVWWLEENQAVSFYSGAGAEYIDEVMLKLMEFEPKEIGNLVWEKWQAYRDGFLSTENICKLLQDNRDELVETGAAAREMKRWSHASAVDMDIDYLLEYQIRRMTWLDKYFAKWNYGE